MSMNKSWDGKVPDWELEPVDGAEQKEVHEGEVQEIPSVAEARIAELAAETKVIAPEDPQKKAAQIEVVRAEIAGISTKEAGSIVGETIEESLSWEKQISNDTAHRLRIDALKKKEKTTLQEDFDIVSDTISNFAKKYNEMVSNSATDKDLDEMEDTLDDLRKQQREMGGLMEIDSKQKELQKLKETRLEHSVQNERAYHNPDKEAFMETKDLEEQISNLSDEIENIKEATKYVTEESSDNNETVGVKTGEAHTQAEGAENHANLTEEIKNENTIRNVHDFNGLMSAIDKIGDIKGSDGYVYKPDYLKDVIGEVFMGRKQLDYVTGTFGLRDKVRSLLEAQQSEMKRRAEEEKEKLSRTPGEEIKDKSYELEELKRLREVREKAGKKPVEIKKKSRSIFNRAG